MFSSQVSKKLWILCKWLFNLHVCLCLYNKCVSGVHGNQQRLSDVWKSNYRQLWAEIQVLECKPGFWKRGAKALNLWAISSHNHHQLIRVMEFEETKRGVVKRHIWVAYKIIFYLGKLTERLSPDCCKEWFHPLSILCGLSLAIMLSYCETQHPSSLFSLKFVSVGWKAKEYAGSMFVSLKSFTW